MPSTTHKIYLSHQHCVQSILSWILHYGLLTSIYAHTWFSTFWPYLGKTMSDQAFIVKMNDSVFIHTKIKWRKSRISSREEIISLFYIYNFPQEPDLTTLRTSLILGVVNALKKKQTLNYSTTGIYFKLFLICLNVFFLCCVFNERSNYLKNYLLLH